MSSKRSRRQNKQAGSKQRRFTVRGVRRDQVDMGKLSKALIGLAAAEAERQAQAEHSAHADDPNQREAASTPRKPARPDGDAHA